MSHLLDLQTPWCAYVAATLKVPHHLEAGTTRIAALAAATDSDERALHGVLAHLVTTACSRSRRRACSR